MLSTYTPTFVVILNTLVKFEIFMKMDRYRSSHVRTSRAEHKIFRKLLTSYICAGIQCFRKRIAYRNIVKNCLVFTHFVQFWTPKTKKILWVCRVANVSKLSKISKESKFWSISGGIWKMKIEVCISSDIFAQDGTNVINNIFHGVSRGNLYSNSLHKLVEPFPNIRCVLTLPE